jgi:hypothetical protein
VLASRGRADEGDPRIAVAASLGGRKLAALVWEKMKARLGAIPRD